MTDVSVSVAIPVKDGAAYLAELLTAVRAQGGEDMEVLVIDSGSRDGSPGIARAHGAQVIEIPPEQFGHGVTRNLAMERTGGDIVLFLTQDATPAPGWLDAHLAGHALADHVGAVYGPHRPRPGTSPMIARELTEFFAGFSPDGLPAIQRAGDEPFLSNVNASYRRACWAEIRFRDVPYAEDQAFGRDLLAAGWEKVYHPGAAVLHAHDYGPLDFMRRYFDEYRGLRETAGHVEPFRPRAVAGTVRAQVAADRRWMRDDLHLDPRRRARWSARSVLHHGGRAVASAAGSRADRLPAPVRRAASLEGRGDGAGAGAVPGAPGLPAGWDAPPRRPEAEFAAVARVLRDGPAPLDDAVPGMAQADRLHIAVVIPPFRRGSGGHGTIFQLVSRLERAGHTCSVWLHDPAGVQEAEWPGVVRQAINDFFSPFQGPAFRGFDDWYGADVALATGWQTAHPVLALPHCRARAYLVNDHEPEFYGTSAEAMWAADSYRHGMHCIAASPWLADLLRDRYGASATDFTLGVDHALYRPQPVERRRDTVVFYARAVTQRRAVPLGVLALEELRRRRPDVRIVAYGDQRPLEAPFPLHWLGVVSPEQLAWVYSEATVGLCLSMTNFSLIPKEMLACGLPCVELAGVSAESIFGADGPLALAAADPTAIADALEALLDDADAWERRAQAGREFVASHTWDLAAEQVHAGIRHALALREAGVLG